MIKQIGQISCFVVLAFSSLFVQAGAHWSGHANEEQEEEAAATPTTLTDTLVASSTPEIPGTAGRPSSGDETDYFFLPTFPSFPSATPSFTLNPEHLQALAALVEEHRGRGALPSPTQATPGFQEFRLYDVRTANATHHPQVVPADTQPVYVDPYTPYLYVGFSPCKRPPVLTFLSDAVNPASLLPAPLAPRPSTLCGDLLTGRAIVACWPDSGVNSPSSGINWTYARPYVPFQTTDASGTNGDAPLLATLVELPEIVYDVDEKQTKAETDENE